MAHRNTWFTYEKCWFSIFFWERLPECTPQKWIASGVKHGLENSPRFPRHAKSTLQLWRTHHGHHDSRSFPKVYPWLLHIHYIQISFQLDIGFSERFPIPCIGSWEFPQSKLPPLWGYMQILRTHPNIILIYCGLYIRFIYPSLFLLKFPLLMVEPPLKPRIPVVFNIIECPHYYSKSDPPVLLFKPKCCLLVGYPMGTGPWVPSLTHGPEQGSTVAIPRKPWKTEDWGGWD